MTAAANAVNLGLAKLAAGDEKCEKKGRQTADNGGHLQISAWNFHLLMYHVAQTESLRDLADGPQRPAAELSYPEEDDQR